MSNILKNKIYDISVEIGKEHVDFPGDTEYDRNLILNSEDSFCNLSKIQMSCHTGTHLDVPYHFYTKGKTLNHYKVEDFIFHVHVIEIMNPNAITVEDVAWDRVKPGDGVLFKTRNSRDGLVKSAKYVPDYVYLTPEAAKKACDIGTSVIGIDYITIEKSDDDKFPSHLEVLGNEVIIVEAINLESIPEGEYTLMCLPLKFNGAEASPVRAILIEV